MLKNKGFSLAETLISLLIMSVAVGAAMHITTKMLQSKTKLDHKVLKCIKSGDFSFYDDITGDTTMPAEGTACYDAITSVKYSISNSLSSIKWSANHGTSAEQTAAKKILKAACNEGGERACDYFVTRCVTNGQTVAPFCDETGYDDVAYYLQKPASSINKGVVYVRDKVEKTLPSVVESLIGEVQTDCTAVPDSVACDLYKPWIFIKACNAGYSIGCTEAFNKNYNKSCSQIKNAWPEATTDTYNLTFKGSSSPVEAECNMTSLPVAVISGCNAITNDSYNCMDSSDPADACSDDCLKGYNNNYNRSCFDIRANWFAAPLDTYNITSNGAPPAALGTDICQGAVANCTDKPGLMCLDGTIYAGDYSGDIFTPPVDQGSFSWNNGLPAYTILYAGALFPNNESDGEYNSYILDRWNTLGNGEYLWGSLKGAPYRAVAACEQLNAINYLNHDDWYLPSFYEFKYTFGDYYADIGGFSPDSLYWTSMWTGKTGACAYEEGQSINKHRGDGTRQYTYKVRCIRKDGDFTPPTLPDDIRPGPVDCSSTTPDIGTLCNDGTIYAGTYGYKKLYTTADNGPGQMSFNNGGLTSPTNIYTYYPYNDYFNDEENGEKNTHGLAKLLVDGEYYWGMVNHTPFQAAKACYDLVQNGYDDWYLPAKNELKFLIDNKKAIGYFYSEHYWSSTINPLGHIAYALSADTGNLKYSTLSYQHFVKCIRDEDTTDSYSGFPPPAKPNVDCQDAIEDPIGSPCLDGTVYAAKSGSTKYFFAKRLYDAEKTWNNGTDDWHQTYINSKTDGLANTNDLLLATDEGNPYLAAQACKYLNDIKYLSYDDWYLPAREEINMLLTNKNDTGWWYSSYWTSTEKDSEYAYIYNTAASHYHKYKNQKFPVRCIRKEP